MQKNKIVKSSFILISSVILAVWMYYYSLSYFWSGFEWSPFGYESCGLEAIVWIGIIPILIVSVVLKIILVWKYKYPKIFWIIPFYSMIVLSILSFEKGFRQGCLSIFFIIVELILSSFSKKKGT